MNAKKIFVIACYYDGTNDSIFECVKSIQKYYKSAKIVVIDSNSPDKSYFQRLKENHIYNKGLTAIDVIQEEIKKINEKEENNE